MNRAKTSTTNPWSNFVVVTLACVSLAACDKLTAKGKADEGGGQPTAMPVLTDGGASVPPVASFNATPVAEYVDAGDLSAQSPYAQAQAYVANGQLWMARLVLEKPALSPSAAPRETELLANICNQQGDAACVDECGAKLGRKLSLDGGVAVSASARPGRHEEPVTELARERDLVLKENYEAARAILEPKVLDGKASKEEVRLLKTACTKQGDRMCIALCNTKLR